MTVSDEEKAEESYINYRNAHCKITRNEINHHLRKDWRKSGIDRHRAYTDGYLDGLAEGRKEVIYMKAEEDEEYLNVCRENEELKKAIEELLKLTKEK